MQTISLKCNNAGVLVENRRKHPDDPLQPGTPLGTYPLLDLGLVAHAKLPS
jgi:hypothetical protein